MLNIKNFGQCTVIPVEERKTYMAVLEKASVEQDIEPLTKFLSHLMKQGIKEKPVAKISNKNIYFKRNSKV